jgi:K+-transporting ATPase A subunit
MKINGYFIYIIFLLKMCKFYKKKKNNKQTKTKFKKQKLSFLKVIAKLLIHPEFLMRDS